MAGGESSPTDIVDSAVNTLKTGWDIMMDGKAQSSAQSSACNAIPQGAKPKELTGWKNKTGKWRFTITNLYGVDVIDVPLHYSFWHNGSIDGKGKFINDFTVYASGEKVLWGYSCDIKATVSGTPMNVGSKDDPIFSLMLLVSARFGSPLKKSSLTWRCRAFGDGKWTRSAG